jgi:hypothetical protein
VSRQPKTPAPGALHAQVVAIDQARAEALNSISVQMERLFSTYFDRVRSTLASIKTKDGAIALQTATAVMSDLHQILIDAGLESVIHDFAHEFPALAEAAVAYYEPFGLDATLAGVASETLAAWVDFSSTQLVNTLDASLIAPVSQALLQVNFGNMTRDALIQQITTLEPSITTTEATTLVNQSFSSFQRGIVVAKGDSAGLEIYQYLGPDDAITSPQCHAMLTTNLHGAEGVLYKDEITPHLHPNLERYGIQPLIEGGHPNCRHVWSPITLGYAKDLGFDGSESKGAEAVA